VVVVSMNYRLGPFGFLAHSALGAEEGNASGNFGIADQQAALRWVQENIEAFGGDPGNVTIFGESAGGLSVCVHLVAPGSEGLFARAISQSGLCDTPAPTTTVAENIGAMFAERLGCGGAADAAACLREASVEAIQEADVAGAEIFQSLGRERAWWPSIGTIMPGGFRERVESGQFQRVPTIVGWNRDEGTLFVMLAEQAADTTATEATYDEAMTSLATAFGASEPLVRAQYPLASYPDPGAAIAAALGHASLACPSRRAARLLAQAGADVRIYRFAYPDAAFLLPGDRDLGAFHSAEIQFVFGHPAQIGRMMFRGDEIPLHDAMRGYWTSFARNGDPDGEGRPAWPAYSNATDTYLGLDRTIAAGTGPDAEPCALWDPATR
jgi:para-nitrobenzyl esterase